MPARPGLSRESVVQAAAELLDEAPGREPTLAELAVRLGVRSPSLYNHIAGQDELRRELALYSLRELSARVARAAIGLSGDAAVGAIADAYRAFAHQRPGLYLAGLRAADPGASDLEAVAEELFDILFRVLAPYELEPEEAIHALRGLRSLAHGFASLELAGGFGLPVDLDESYRRLIALYLRGLSQHEFRPRGSSY